MRAFITYFTEMGYATRVKVAATSLLLLTALFNNLSFARQNHALRSKAATYVEIPSYEKRFEELKKWLPERGVVGYVSDETDEIEETEKYYLTQYALAPLIVVRGADRPLVVGNFSRGAGEAAGASLTPLKDFGNGVVLLGSEKK